MSNAAAARASFRMGARWSVEVANSVTMVVSDTDAMLESMHEMRQATRSRLWRLISVGNVCGASPNLVFRDCETRRKEEKYEGTQGSGMSRRSSRPRQLLRLRPHLQ